MNNRNSNEPFIIMFVGKTHTGKTTTAKLLEKSLGFITLDIDDIDQFTKKYYSRIVNFEKENREFYNIEKFTPFLKLQIQTIVMKYAISLNMGVILSNGNCSKEAKDYQRKIAKELGVTLVAINFKLNDEEIKERINIAKKDTNVLTVSGNFLEVLDKQNSIFGYADKKDADYLLNIDASESNETIVLKIIEFLKMKGLL